MPPFFSHMDSGSMVPNLEGDHCQSCGNEAQDYCTDCNEPFCENCFLVDTHEHSNGGQYCYSCFPIHFKECGVCSEVFEVESTKYCDRCFKHICLRCDPDRDLFECCNLCRVAIPCQTCNVGEVRPPSGKWCLSCSKAQCADCYSSIHSACCESQSLAWYMHRNQLCFFCGRFVLLSEIGHSARTHDVFCKHCNETTLGFDDAIYGTPSVGY